VFFSHFFSCFGSGQLILRQLLEGCGHATAKETFILPEYYGDYSGIGDTPGIEYGQL
jgi:hypothetical protein